MTHETDDNGKVPKDSLAPRVKKGSAMPNINLPDGVADDLRAFIFNLIDNKEWAGRSDKQLAADITNADEEGTDEPRFYTLEDKEKVRLKFETVKLLLRTYRHRSLEVFREDLMPYIQEAVVEVIKTAGSKPANLKIILDALGIGKEVKNKDDSTGKNTPSPTYTEVRKRIGLDGDAPKRTRGVTTGLRTLGYEDTVRDDSGKRRRPAAGVVPRRSDTGLDGPPNVIEVDGGPYAFAAFPSQDDILDYGREHLVDTEEPGYSDTDKLSGAEVDEKGDGQD